MPENTAADRARIERAHQQLPATVTNRATLRRLALILRDRTTTERRRRGAA